MLTFIQFVSPVSSCTEITFLSVQNVLEDFASANSDALISLIKDELQRCRLHLENLKGLTTDGAAVMVGKNSGVAAQLKRLNPVIISIHCICHKLALACSDTNKEIAYTTWVDLLPCITVAVLQIFRALDERGCATAHGLFKRLNDGKFLGVLFILKDVLPVLSHLSKAFQAGLWPFPNSSKPVLRSYWKPTHHQFIYQTSLKISRCPMHNNSSFTVYKRSISPVWKKTEKLDSLAVLHSL